MTLTKNPSEETIQDSSPSKALLFHSYRNTQKIRKLVLPYTNHLSSVHAFELESWIYLHFIVLQQEFQNYTVARDTFLAQLGATLWGSMRRIISPSIADGAFHYYEKISFQLFFITQEVWGVCVRILYF